MLINKIVFELVSGWSNSRYSKDIVTELITTFYTHGFFFYLFYYY